MPPSVGIGNVLGSNIANIGLVLGVTALVVPLAVRSQTLWRELPVLLLVTSLALGLMFDGDLSAGDGVVLLVSLLLVLAWMVHMGLKDRHDPLAQEFDESISVQMGVGKSFAWFAVSLVLLIASSRMLVWGAEQIAVMLGVSELAIGLTVVAIGTSLPELTASVVSALKHEADLAVGNAIGSNLFNLLAVLAMPALIAPGPFAEEALTRDFPVMLGFTLALFVISFGCINRLAGGLLASCFAAYLYLIFLQAW